MTAVGWGSQGKSEAGRCGKGAAGRPQRRRRLSASLSGDPPHRLTVPAQPAGARLVAPFPLLLCPRPRVLVQGAGTGGDPHPPQR